PSNLGSRPASNVNETIGELSEHLKARKVTFNYNVQENVNVSVGNPNGISSVQPQVVQKTVTGELDLDCDLEKIDLPDEGKRAGVQAVTAARHPKLLQSLKEAKTESEKDEAGKKLEANYRAHYSVETDWRMKRLAELEKRLEEMRAQLKERAGSEEKYVEAAMTLAKLHAQGIVAEPPKLNGSNAQGYGTTGTNNYLPLSGTGGPAYPQQNAFHNFRNNDPPTPSPVNLQPFVGR
ncbi:MAG: hypothetical protein ABL921_32930, partial [Pirellula sp.]